MAKEFLVSESINYKRAGTSGFVGGRALPGYKGSGSKTDDRVVVGIASVFGSTDTGGDVVAPDAFHEPIKVFKQGRTRCRFLWNHNSNEPPVAHILDLKVLSRGELPKALLDNPRVSGALQVTRKYFTDAYSERIYQGVVTGAIGEMSFAYEPDEFHYEDQDGFKVRVLDKVTLFDCSDVVWGMHSETIAQLKYPAILTAAKVKEMEAHRLNERKLDQMRAELEYLDPSAQLLHRAERLRRERELSRQGSQIDQNQLKLNNARLRSLRAGLI